MKAVGPNQSPATHQPGARATTSFSPAGEDFPAAIADHRAQTHGAMKRSEPEDIQVVDDNRRDSDSVTRLAGKLLDVLGGLEDTPQGIAVGRRASREPQELPVTQGRKERRPASEETAAAVGDAAIVGAASALGSMFMVDRTVAQAGWLPPSPQVPPSNQQPRAPLPELSPRWHGEALPQGFIIKGGASSREMVGPSARSASDRTVAAARPAPIGNLELSVVDQTTHFAPVQLEMDGSNRDDAGAPPWMSMSAWATLARKIAPAEALPTAPTDPAPIVSDGGRISLDRSPVRSPICFPPDQSRHRPSTDPPPLRLYGVFRGRSCVRSLWNLHPSNSDR